MQVIDNKHLSEASSQLRELAQRVASSPPLNKSPRLRELFLYLLERSMKGDAVELREQSIGEEVFGRTPGYDTGADNIVRVSVFQLRKKLDRYFAEAGSSEPVILTIPKGHYFMEFNRRGAIESEAAPPLAESRVPPPSPAEPPPPNPRVSRRQHAWRIAAGAVAVLAAALTLWLWPGRAPSPTSTVPEHHRFWGAVLGSGSDAYIVVADVGFSLLQDISGLTLGIDEYLSGLSRKQSAAIGDFPPELIQRLVERQYTSVSNSSIAFRLGAISNAMGARAVVRSARSIDIRDLKTHHVVLLGSSRSNPWVSLLKDRMNFRMEYETSPPRGFIRNTNPLNGEPEVLRATAAGGSPGEAFGLIAYLPNLDETGHIVSIAGTNMEGTEAAAEVLLNEGFFKAFVKRLNVTGGAPIPYFEAVIRAASIGGAGSAPEIVAVRTRPTKD